ncbi:MAG: peptidoglycan-binding protein [Candidatus Competibacteraceae bacterium]|nr:peptidoglycan-binding protein [Candidatus Competibacteraceae bacterium]
MSRLLRQGYKGADVRAIQDVLNFHIRRLDPLSVDGDFGPKTHARVMEFQKANHLTVDGLVGPKTLGKLFEEEMVPISLTLTPNLTLTLPPFGQRPLRQPPQLIPPLTLPPLLPPILSPFLLPPASLSSIPTLNQRGQALNLTLTAPVRNDPLDPKVKSYQQIMHLLNFLPQNFPFRAFLLDKVPKPVTKVGPLELDPVKPMSFGFKWGVKPLFDLKSVGPPAEFTAGVNPSARYTLKLINRPGSTVPQLGLFGQGDFKGTIDWTSEKAQSRPLLELKGSVIVGIEGRF